MIRKKKESLLENLKSLVGKHWERLERTCKNVIVVQKMQTKYAYKKLAKPRHKMFLVVRQRKSLGSLSIVQLGHD